MSNNTASTAAVTVELTSAEAKFAKRLVPYLICKVGLAINEGPKANTADLHEKSMENYIAMADSLEIGAPHLVTMMMVRDMPRQDAIPTIRKHVKSIIKSDVSKIWTRLANLKSEFRNYWIPNYEVKSGENDTSDEPLFRVLKHVWAYRKNRSIKAYNKRAKNKDNQKRLVSHDEAPSSIKQDDELVEEAPAFMHVVKDHPFFQKKKSPNSSAAAHETGTESNVAKLTKSRKQQRTEEMDAKRQRTIEKNSSAKKYDAFLVAQTNAVNQISALAKHRYDMELISLGMKMGYKKDVLEEKLEKLLSAPAPEESVVDLTNAKETYVEADDKDVSVVTEIVSVEDDVGVPEEVAVVGPDVGAALDNGAFPTGRCCLGEKCKNPSLQLRPQHKCVTCGEIVHALDSCSWFDYEEDKHECLNCHLG